MSITLPNGLYSGEKTHCEMQPNFCLRWIKNKLMENRAALLSHSMDIRVHYHETDGQRRLHNSQYLNYFERGRVELLRSVGHSYRELEQTGLLLVVTRMEIDYHQPAEFDDLLLLTCGVTYSRGARCEHTYALERKTDEALIATGLSQIACVDSAGKVARLPRYMQLSQRGDRSRSV